MSVPLLAAAARAARMLRLRASSVGVLLGEVGGGRPGEDAKRRRVRVPTPNLPNRHHLVVIVPALFEDEESGSHRNDWYRPPLGDDPHGTGRHQAVQGPALSRPGPQIGGRDVEPGDRHPLARPPGRRAAGVAGPVPGPVDHHQAWPAPAGARSPPTCQRGGHVGPHDQEQLPAGRPRGPRGSGRCSWARPARPRAATPRGRGCPRRRPDHGQAVAAGAATLPRFCQGSPAGTRSTRSSDSARRASTAATTCATWTGSKVPPKTPSRSDPSEVLTVPGSIRGARHR